MTNAEIIDFYIREELASLTSTERLNAVHRRRQEFDPHISVEVRTSWRTRIRELLGGRR